MPTRFNVIPLGLQATLDPTEGNRVAEGAASLVGETFGDVQNPLWEGIALLTPGSTGFRGGGRGFYDQNNAISNDTFRIDNGPDQVFDGGAGYRATITYTDGTTATISAVIFQDTNGNTYLAPEFDSNPDQAALEAGPIQSLSLDALLGNDFSGMVGQRERFDFVVCFAQGTRIRTPGGDRPVETLRVGDLVTTHDRGPQPIRWIRGRRVAATGAFLPVRIARDALGPGVPSRDLLVSRQHRMLVQSRIAARMFGSSQVLIAANKLTGLPGVDDARDLDHVCYWHFLCEQHEIVFAEDAPSETLYLGKQARQALEEAALAEIDALFPELLARDAPPAARAIPGPRQQRRLMERTHRNRSPVLDGWERR